MSSTKNNVSEKHFPFKIDEFCPKRYFFNRDEEEMIDQTLLPGSPQLTTDEKWDNTRKVETWYRENDFENFKRGLVCVLYHEY